jgi:O-antigen/teichoic acid export membrane protein
VVLHLIKKWSLKAKKLGLLLSFRKHFSDFFWSSFGAGIYSIINFLINIYAAKLLGPEIFGIWNLLNLYIVYGSFLHLGVINGIGRQIPFYDGIGEKETVTEIQTISFYFVLIVSLLYSFLLVIISFFLEEKNPIKNYLFLTCLLFFSKQIRDYVGIYLRSVLAFKKLGQYNIVSAFLLLFLIFFFTKKNGLIGFIFSQIFTFFISSFLFFKPPRFNLLLLRKKEILVSLIKIGFPIMMAGYLYNLLISVDRLIIAKYLGLKNLGQYSIAIIMLGVVGFFPSIISNLIYPRMVREFSYYGKEMSLKRYINIQILFDYILIIPIFIFFYFIFPVIVKNFMPAYIEGIEPMRIVLIGTLFLPLAAGSGDFLNTIGKQNYYLFVQFVSLIINIISSFVFVNIFNLGLKGVAFGTSFAYFNYGLFLFYISRRYFRKCL